MDHTTELLKRLRDTKDSFTERKLESDNAREFRKVIVAFANSLSDERTGTLFIGVKDDGTVRGVRGVAALQDTIADQCKNVCYPPIEPFPLVTVLVVGGRNVLAVEVRASTRRPHFTGPAYIRVGTRSENASQELFTEMLTSHCGKAGAIQKLKGRIVTIELMGKTLDGRVDPDYHGEPECFVTAVTPHSVTFRYASQEYSHPIEKFAIAEDVRRHRPYKLILKA